MSLKTALKNIFSKRHLRTRKTEEWVNVPYDVMITTRQVPVQQFVSIEGRRTIYRTEKLRTPQVEHRQLSALYQTWYEASKVKTVEGPRYKLYACEKLKPYNLAGYSDYEIWLMGDAASTRWSKDPLEDKLYTKQEVKARLRTLS